MSALEVRTAFRAAWDNYLPGVPYVDAINEEPALPGALFGTLSFEAADRRDASMGSQAWVTEEGTVAVSIFSRSGSGDGAAVALARQAALWFGNSQFGDDLRVTSIAGPNDAPQAEGEWFEQVVSVAYEWQGREAR